MRRTLALRSTLINLLGLIVIWVFWLVALVWPSSPGGQAALAVGASVAILPTVWLGRKLLDRQPDLSHAARITSSLHFVIAILFGAGLIAATRFALGGAGTWPGALTSWPGLGLMLFAGLLWLGAVVQLILKGQGLPFAASLTRVVVTEWLYAWTRNPIVLSTLAFLVGLGLWLRSGLFLVWVLAVFSPAVLVYLKVYEERELEVRFGASYLDYRARTPLLFPRPPRESK